jgi:hypothetical protein
MFTRHEHGLHTMTALWLLPVVPACVAANTAGVLASKMGDAGHALVVLYLGGCQGLLLTWGAETAAPSAYTSHQQDGRCGAWTRGDVPRCVGGLLMVTCDVESAVVVGASCIAAAAG